MGEDLPSFVRRRARDLGLTQGELAQRAGISRQAVVKLLSGETIDPQISTVGRLATALNVAPIYLFQLLMKRSVIERSVQQMARLVGDHSAFVHDLTVPNGAIFPPGCRFEKVWQIQNAGRVIWADRWLECQNCDRESDRTLRPDVPKIPIPLARPGAVVILSVWFTAPSTPCTATSVWKMTDCEGTVYFPQLDGLDCTISVAVV